MERERDNCQWIKDCHLKRVVAHLDVQVDYVELVVCVSVRKGDENDDVHDAEKGYQDQDKFCKFSGK